MFKYISKRQIYLSVFMVLLSFLQAYNWWEVKKGLSLFFLISGILILILNIIVITLYKRKQIAKIDGSSIN